jgi:hypothetical protein
MVHNGIESMPLRPYAEGQHPGSTPTSAHARQASAEHTLRDPYYQFNSIRRHRRGLAPAQRRLVVAARSDRGGVEQEL